MSIKNFNWFCNQKEKVLFERFPYKFLLSHNVVDNFNLANITQYKKDNRLNNLDLITCDGSLKIPPNKFNEQETYIGRLIIWEIITILNLLPSGKTALIKLFLPICETYTVNLLYLLTHLFEETSIIKPTTGHPSSSEIYLVLKKYIGINNIPKIVYDRLLYLFNNYNQNMGIFSMNEIDDGFIKELKKISSTLCDRQIRSIKRSIDLRNIYYDNVDVQNDISSLRDQIINNWIENIKINKLEKNKLLVRN
jgi:hypothetical protein